MFELFEKLKASNKIVGFTCGTFDVLHPGHVMMLEESKANCDYLIVGLLSDPTISRPTKNKPVQSMWERYVQLQSIKAVDWIVPWDTEEDLVNMLQMISPNIRFVGEEYRDVDFTGKNLPLCIFYNRRTHKYSSTATRQKVEDTPLGRKVIVDEGLGKKTLFDGLDVPTPNSIKFKTGKYVGCLSDEQCYCHINTPGECHHCRERAEKNEKTIDSAIDNVKKKEKELDPDCTCSSDGAMCWSCNNKILEQLR